MARVECKVLGWNDAGVLTRTADDVFDGPVVAENAVAFLADPAHMLVVALDDGVVVGMLSSVRYLHPDKPPQLWINEVGVTASHRGQGIGRALVELTLAEARRCGCVEAWVGSDAGEGALAFYRAVGGEELSGQTQFTWHLDGH